MKTTIRIASVAVLAIGLIQLTRVLLPGPAANASQLPHELFHSFSVGHVKNVEFEWGGGSLRHLNQRQRQEQALDWLELGLLSDAGFSQDELNKLTFDLPPVRAGYFHSIGAFEYGPSRSRFLGNGRVLVLVPAESPEARTSTLARIADEQRKNTGQIPQSLLIFEYDLDPDYAHARLVRCSDAAGAGLYTEQAGYREKRIQAPADLQDFLGATNDLTYAKLDNGSLILGGRSISNGVQKITPDDVAALWQSEQSLKANRDAIDAFKAKWDNATYSTEEEKEELIREHDKEEAELRVDYRRVEKPPVAVSRSIPCSTIAD